MVELKRSGWSCILCAMLFLIMRPPRAMADIEDMAAEENIADLLPAKFPEKAQPLNPDQRQWALLPQAGYGPDTGVVGGLKFSHRNLFKSQISFDLGGVYGIKGQQSFTLSIGSPHLAHDRVIVLLRARWDVDPKRRFFGLGNNDVGPEPASIHEIQDGAWAITTGWRPFEHVAFNFAFGARRVSIWCPSTKIRGSTPCTKSEFPLLPGIDGGWVNYLGLSVVWNNRDSIVRPTRGWRLILKGIHTNRVLLSDYEFTRFVGDASYLRSFFHERLILGVRINGEWVNGPDRQIPFWELSELGGMDTLRGFFPHRFVGKGLFLVNTEVRYGLTEFDFIRLWHVRIDGVVFGDGGRVFLASKDINNEFALNQYIIGPLLSDLRYSYGCGVRIALSQSLVARIDVGFSEEEKGLVYLSFGQTF